MSTELENEIIEFYLEVINFISPKMSSLGFSPGKLKYIIKVRLIMLF
jgi:hypothetical protein